MLYSGEKGNSIVSLCEKVINDVFLSGSFVKTENINWEDYIEGKAVIMKYPFYVSSGEYMKGYGISNSAFSESVKSINYIVVAPGKRKFRIDILLLYRRKHIGSIYIYAQRFGVAVGIV